jgi:hypothetical protein
MTDTTTPEGQAKRLRELYPIKEKHDKNWRKLESITGDGDYLPADAGEPPKGSDQ